MLVALSFLRKQESRTSQMKMLEKNSQIEICKNLIRILDEALNR